MERDSLAVGPPMTVPEPESPSAPKSKTRSLSDVGVVVIGRNEGDRLRRCLTSVVAQSSSVVYVDSGSTDDSVPLAREIGCEVVELDSSIPFSAARARNVGFDRLCTRQPSIAFVMFVDGDCEVVASWIETARAALECDSDVAVVAGRLRERFPNASIYNRLCDMEWNAPAGEAKSCGGIAVVRVRAFAEAEGFNPRVVAGEEPELCVRLRRRGWKILRLDAEMALHDAAMTQFRQWWKRAIRSGHAYAEGVALYGGRPERHFVRETISCWLYGFAIPLAMLTGLILIGPWSLLLLLIYPWLFWKIAAGRRRSHRDPWNDALLYAGACVIAKPAECLGQIRYWRRRLLGHEPEILEHKRVSRG